MAQIIKHRRGSIDALASVTAKKGELIMATGSVGNMQGPWIFVGETEGSAGAFRGLSKIYQGAAAPDLTVGTWGSTLNGTPFHSSNNKTLYILSNVGNTTIDLTGNIEGNVISGVTINNITGSRASFSTYVSASALNVTNNTQIGGTLFVDGDTSINADLYVTGNTYQTGSIDLTGNIKLGGNINIGDATTDFVTFGAEISSSIVPDVHNAFDLGSSSKNWRNLHVSGTAYVDTLEANNVNFGDLGILNDLTVSGSTFLGNGGDITVISGSIYNDQLTEKRLVVVGTNGLLTNYSGLTFDNGNLNLSGALEVTNIQGTGSLYLKPDLNDSRDFRIYNTGGPSDIHIKGNASYSFFGDDTNYLKIDDLTNTITIESLSGVTIDTDTTVNGYLMVTGTTELRGAVGMNSTLDVTGSAQFKSTINVDGEATLASATVEDLTQNRIVTVGVGGSLIDSSGFTYNGTVLKIGNGQFEVDTNDGDIRTSGSLTIEGTTTINDNLNVTGVLTVTGNTQLQSNLYISGNLEVLGSATNVTIQSATIELDDNIIRLNAYSPFERYAGFEVIDSGSTGVSASMVWDGLNDYWMFVSSSGQSSKFIGTTAGTYGSETSLTSTYFPIATGPNTIGDSLLRYSGTTLSFNTNKFTIDSGTGDTLVSGNFTLSYSGGTDNANKTSAIMFRNSSNVVGFVSTTETTDVLDGILGYKNSDGALKFSTVIDGGTY
jgi:cytoskeletal protein CcmA (bactofilin family)